MMDVLPIIVQQSAVKTFFALTADITIVLIGVTGFIVLIVGWCKGWFKD